MKVGYRHIDTAQGYGNKRGVGEGVRTCGIPLEESFVTTKLQAFYKTYGKAKAAIDQSLADSGLDYFDLMLIHAPQPWTNYHIAHGEMLKNEGVLDMAEKYGVSVAQLCIRYCLQLGAVPLPKAMTPAHTVTLTQDYLMGETEVTEALWNAVMADGGGSNTHPKTGITWSEAHTFAEQLTLLAHEQGLISDEKAFRLPTEAQWEFAAKGGNLSQGYLYSGSDDMDEVAVTNENSGSNAPLGVKTKAPNELGLYDRWGVFMLIFVSDKTAGTGHATHPHFLSL